MFAKPIAVIGANSFSGHAFCRYIESRGGHVVRISRPLHDFRRPESIAEATIACGFGCVVNFAALNMVAPSWPEFEDYYLTNIVGVAKVASTLQQRGWKGRWVQVSTPEVYGEVKGTIYEGHLFNPSTPYAISRAACDMHLKALHRTFGFEVLFTRAVNVYGPRQQVYRLIPKLVLSILRGKRFTLDGGGAAVRGFLHCDDMASGIAEIMEHGNAGDDFHIGVPDADHWSIRGVVDMICHHMNVDPHSVLDIGPERPGKDSNYQLDWRTLREFFGWKPQYTFSEGLKETVSWVVNNRDFYEGQSLTYEHRP